MPKIRPKGLLSVAKFVGFFRFGIAFNSVNSLAASQMRRREAILCRVCRSCRHKNQLLAEKCRLYRRCRQCHDLILCLSGGGGIKMTAAMAAINHFVFKAGYAAKAAEAAEAAK